MPNGLCCANGSAQVTSFLGWSTRKVKLLYTNRPSRPKAPVDHVFLGIAGPSRPGLEGSPIRLVNHWRCLLNNSEYTKIYDEFANDRITIISGWDWLRSRIGAHNKLSESEQLLSLFLFPESSSNSNWKLKSIIVPAYLCLERTSFPVIAHRKLPGKIWLEKLSSLLSWPTFSGLLWWPTQGLSSSGRDVTLYSNSHQIIACFIMSIDHSK